MTSRQGDCSHRREDTIRTGQPIYDHLSTSRSQFVVDPMSVECVRVNPLPCAEEDDDGERQDDEREGQLEVEPGSKDIEDKHSTNSRAILTCRSNAHIDALRKRRRRRWRRRRRRRWRWRRMRIRRRRFNVGRFLVRNNPPARRRSPSRRRTAAARS